MIYEKRLFHIFFKVVSCSLVFEFEFCFLIFFCILTSIFNFRASNFNYFTDMLLSPISGKN